MITVEADTLVCGVKKKAARWMRLRNGGLHDGAVVIGGRGEFVVGEEISMQSRITGDGA